MEHIKLIMGWLIDQEGKTGRIEVTLK